MKNVACRAKLASSMGTMPLCSQRGQVMPMTVVFILVVILAVWVLYDSGQVATEKLRLQNTADNVAYSTATLAARDMNFIAYTNRAMVANQVTIAQLVGLSSWMAMMNQIGHNADAIGDIAGYFPPIGSMIDAVTTAIKNATEAGGSIVDAAVEVLIPVTDELIGLLSVAQLAYHTTTIAAMAGLSADIARQNDPAAIPMLGISGLSASEPAEFASQWASKIGGQNQLHSVSDGSEEAELELRRYREFESVVVESRDRFTKKRSYEWPGNPHPWKATFPLAIRWETRKYGGTDLFRSTDSDDEYEWSWAGMDTVSTYFSFWKCGASFPPCHWSGYDELLPLGWGAAHALPSGESDDYFEYGGSRRNNRFWGDGTWRNSVSAGLLADTGEAEGALESFSPFIDHTRHKVANIDGLRKFYDFRSDEPMDNGPAVIAFYKKPASGISNVRGMIESGGGSVPEELDAQTESGLVDDKISAIAKAEAYFARATDLDGWKRVDDKYEHGNLYNPFWQPRLIDLTDAEKTAASVAAGVMTGGAL